MAISSSRRPLPCFKSIPIRFGLYLVPLFVTPRRPCHGKFPLAESGGEDEGQDNESVDESSLTNENIFVYGEISGRHISDNISYIDSEHKLIFDPRDNFFPGELISTTLTNKIMYENIDSLFNPHIWSFYYCLMNLVLELYS